MREIKFRGKRIDNGDWVGGNLYDSVMLSTLGCKCIQAKFGPISIEYPVDPETVGQFTGLQDKNGKDIYEGDVVNWGYGDTTVEFKEMQCEVCTASDEPVLGWFVRDCGLNDGCEVAGNIHDNPELLT